MEVGTGNWEQGTGNREVATRQANGNGNENRNGNGNAKGNEKRHKLKGESVEVCGLLPRAGHEQETGGQRQVKG